MRAVNPLSFPAAVCCLAGMTEEYASQKSVKQRPRWYAAGMRAGELPATLPRAVADEVGHDLARGAARRDPDPALTLPSEHERPEFVQLQVAGSRVLRVGLAQRVAQLRERGVLFLSHPVTVLRETPKVRVRPRRLLRSW